jgi:hypothetical protein
MKAGPKRVNNLRDSIASFFNSIDDDLALRRSLKTNQISGTKITMQRHQTRKGWLR